MDNILSDQFFKIINKFFEKQYSKNLEDRVHYWLINPNNLQDKERAMRQQWDSLNNIKDLSSKIEYEKIKKKLDFGEKKTKIKFSHYLSRVAAVLLPLVICIGICYFYMTGDKNKDVQMAELTVPYGKHEQKDLAFGTEIWVNSGSKISYNENVEDNIRVVNLVGEAYLSVVRHNDIPFIVRTKYLDVKVLGTQFNVSAYPNEESTVVTLNQGSIEIQTTDNRMFKLKTNQQLVYNNQTGEVIIQNIDVSVAQDIADWTIGKMTFSNQTLREIVITLERGFNINIEVDKHVDLNRRYTITIDEGDSLNEIIEIFRFLDNSLSYKLENNKIYISNK